MELTLVSLSMEYSLLKTWDYFMDYSYLNFIINI